MSITGNTFANSKYLAATPSVGLTVVSSGGRAAVALKLNIFTANGAANNLTEPTAACITNGGGTTQLSVAGNKGLLPKKAPFNTTSDCSVAAIAQAP